LRQEQARQEALRVEQQKQEALRLAQEAAKKKETRKLIVSLSGLAGVSAAVLGATTMLSPANRNLQNYPPQSPGGYPQQDIYQPSTLTMDK
jgi:hypothetical protein